MGDTFFLTMVLVFVCVFFYSCTNSLAAPVSQVILVLWHGMEWEDIQNLNGNQLQAVGIMNTRVGGGLGVEGAYLSISAGARGVGTVGAGSFFMDYEPNHFTLHTGLPPSPIVQPLIGQVITGLEVNYNVFPGALGSAIAAAGKKVTAYGNSDTAELKRWAGMVAMDKSGRIFDGDVGRNILLEDEDYPYGVKTSYEL